MALTRQIVVEIHAPDSAMEELAGEYGDDGSGCSSSQPEEEPATLLGLMKTHSLSIAIHVYVLKYLRSWLSGANGGVAGRRAGADEAAGLHAGADSG